MKKIFIVLFMVSLNNQVFAAGDGGGSSGGESGSAAAEL